MEVGGGSRGEWSLPVYLPSSSGPPVNPVLHSQLCCLSSKHQWLTGTADTSPMFISAAILKLRLYLQLTGASQEGCQRL